jgi:hypothetical protein
MIFSRKQLKVVKMSNKRLMILVGALLALEFILLACWHELSPLQPVEYIRNVSGRFHQATHCSLADDQGMTFVIIEAVYKGTLLVGGTMLAFSTRKVSSAFNESSQIAFSIYNVTFSAAIIGGIIAIVGAFEDVLILLFLFLFFWIALVTWGLLFATKFWTLFTQSEAEAANASKIDSLQTEKSAGFSFVSVIGMQPALLKGYVAALEGQLLKARKQLSTLLGTTGQGLGIGVGPKPLAASASKYSTRRDTSLPGQSLSSVNDPYDPIGTTAHTSIACDEQEKDVLHMRYNSKEEPPMSNSALPPGLEHCAPPSPQWANRVSSVNQQPHDPSIPLHVTSPPSAMRGLGSSGATHAAAAPSSRLSQDHGRRTPDRAGKRPQLTITTSTDSPIPSQNTQNGPASPSISEATAPSSVNATRAPSPEMLAPHEDVAPTASTPANATVVTISSAVRPSSRAMQAHQSLLDSAAMKE